MSGSDRQRFLWLKRGVPTRTWTNSIFTPDFVLFPYYYVNLVVYNIGEEDLGCQHEGAYSRWRVWYTIEAFDTQCAKAAG